MKKESIIAALLILILFVCLIGVEGQYYAPQPEVIGQTTPYQTTSMGQPMQYSTTPSEYQTTAPITTATPTSASQYAQYYTMGPAPTTHITAPQPFNIEGNTPSAVYSGSQMQAVPYPQYYATYTGGNLLWIQGSASWTQYAKVPQGSILSLLAISPTGGEGSLFETYPDGKVSRSDFYFYPTSLMGFYADTPGRHVLSFVLAGQPSNQVAIEVVGTYKPPSYYTPPSYYAGYYPWYWDYYPYYWDYYPYYWGYYPAYSDHHYGDGDHHQGDGADHQGDGPSPSPPNYPPNPPPTPPPSDGDGYQDAKPGLGPKDKTSPSGNAWGFYKWDN
jgi:hypothetical protein